MFSRNAIRKLLKECGAKRVSVEACEELRKHLQKLATEILKDAKALCAHAGRKTISIEDIKLAWKRMHGRG